MSFKPTHILSASQITSKTHLLQILKRARKLKSLVESNQHQKLESILAGKTLANVFMEPSTRTQLSFQSAFQRLGGHVLSITDPSVTSISKGETLEDTVKVLHQYSDVIVMRHPTKGALAQAASVSRVPVINAGDGVGEHPSQALLDILTATEELGVESLDGKTFVLVGDLKNGRTVHSLVQLLSLFDNIQIIYVCPPSLCMPEYIVNLLDSKQVKQTQVNDLKEVASQADVLYMTRVQKERFSSTEEYEKVKGCYIINQSFLKTHCKKAGEMVVMHPLPRVDEIATDMDDDPRAAYFRQVRYGLFMRMALFTIALNATVDGDEGEIGMGKVN